MPSFHLAGACDPDRRSAVKRELVPQLTLPLRLKQKPDTTRAHAEHVSARAVQTESGPLQQSFPNQRRPTSKTLCVRRGIRRALISGTSWNLDEPRCGKATIGLVTARSVPGHQDQRRARSLPIWRPSRRHRTAGAASVPLTAPAAAAEAGSTSQRLGSSSQTTSWSDSPSHPPNSIRTRWKRPPLRHRTGRRQSKRRDDS